MDLSNNKLHGDIPVFIGENNFTGSVPATNNDTETKATIPWLLKDLRMLACFILFLIATCIISRLLKKGK